VVGVLVALLSAGGAMGLRSLGVGAMCGSIDESMSASADACCTREAPEPESRERDNHDGECCPDGCGCSGCVVCATGVTAEAVRPVAEWTMTVAGVDHFESQRAARDRRPVGIF